LYYALAKYNDLISQAEDIITEVYNDMWDDAYSVEGLQSTVDALYHDTQMLNALTPSLPDVPPVDPCPTE